MTSGPFEDADPALRMMEAGSPEDVAIVRELFREYAADIGIDLAFQQFEDELHALPGEYAQPSGRLSIARLGGDVAGCVALRRIDDVTCEMKRLYIRPAHRGIGLGRALAVHVIAEGRRAGYPRMRLDTLGTMTAAIALYRSLGFNTIPPYRYNPMPDAVYLERQI